MFLPKFLLKETAYKIVAGKVKAQFTPKATNPEKAIYFLSLMFCLMNRCYSHVKIFCFPILHGKNFLVQEMLPLSLWPCLNNIDLGDDFGDDVNNVRLVKFIVWWNRYKQCKRCKKRNKRRLNVYRISLIKIMGLLYAKRWKRKEKLV